MPYLSHITLVGHAGKDAIQMTTKTGKPMTKLTLAVSTGWGENKETTWWNVTAFDKPAEWAKDVKKGEVILVQGEAKSRKYQKSEGGEGTSVEVSATKILQFKIKDKGVEMIDNGALVPPS